MQKPTFFNSSTFFRALVLATLPALAIFLSPVRAAQQTPASSGSPTPALAAQAKPSATAGSQAPSTAPKKPATTKTGQASSAKSAAALTLKTDKDKISYAIGMNVGKRLENDLKQLKQGDTEVDTTILVRAIKDALSGGKLLMTDQEAQTTLTTLQADLRKRMEEKQKLAAETNKKEGDEFLAANKTKDGVVALPDGLQYKVLQEGTGPKPAAGDSVTVNYRGTLLNSTEFDSSYKRGQPAQFPVGGVIKGWTEALQLMPVGSKWQVFIPSDLAYGPSGRPPVIGPNSTLVFEVELVSIQPKPSPSPAPAPAAAPVQPAMPNAAPATTPNPAATPNSAAPPKPTLPSPKPDQAPAPTPTPAPPKPQSP